MSKIKHLGLSFILFFLSLKANSFDSASMRIMLTKSPLNGQLFQESIKTFQNLSIYNEGASGSETFLDEINCQSLSQSNLKLNFFQDLSNESSQQINFTCDDISAQYANAIKRTTLSNHRSPASFSTPIVTIIISSN